MQLQRVLDRPGVCELGLLLAGPLALISLLGFPVLDLGSIRGRKPGDPCLCRGCFVGVAQPVELLFCKQGVRGSSPLASSGDWLSAASVDIQTGFLGSLRGSNKERAAFSEGCPSGQREQAVNLPAYAYGGSNPPPSTGSNAGRDRGRLVGRIDRLADDSGWRYSAPPFRGSSSVGRASAFQAERRGFESRLPLRSPWINRQPSPRNAPPT